MISLLRDLGGYLAMALGGCLAAGGFFYVRVILIGVKSGEAQEYLATVEGCALMMSGILIAGSLYHRWFGDEDEVGSIRKFLGWRIQLFHLITLGLIVADAVL